MQHLRLNANVVHTNWEYMQMRSLFLKLDLRTQGLDVLSHLAPSCLSSGPHFIQVPRGLAGTHLSASTATTSAPHPT